jgi:hypothetical protein
LLSSRESQSEKNNVFLQRQNIWLRIPRKVGNVFRIFEEEKGLSK